MTKTPRLRVALVGCGRIAQTHCGYLRQLPDVELVGACDVSPAGREAFTARWQLPSFADVDELLSAAQPHVVHVVTPPATHSALAIQLLNAGVHVLVEKPMALTAAEAADMRVAARRTGRHLTVNHNRWFDPVVQRARALLQSGALGTLVGVEVFQGAAAGEADAPAGQAAHWSTELPGGVLFNLAPHPVYLLRGFVGPIEQVEVLARRDGQGRLCELRALVAGESALGGLTISLQAQPFMNRLTLLGTRMTAEVNLNNMTLITRRTRRAPKLVGKVLPNLDEALQLVRATVVNAVEFVRGRQRYFPGMGVHFAALYRALAAGEAPPVSADDGYEAVALQEQLWERAGAQQASAARRAVGA
jgi:predicted dehydrogenase